MEEAFLQWCLTVGTHAAFVLVLLVYVPIRALLRLLRKLASSLSSALAPGGDAGLHGKVVLITGASSGIGEALAYEYARRRASLALVARTEKALRAVAEEARRRGAPDVIVVPGDISDAGEASQAVKATVAHFGKLDYLVANAGVWSSCRFEDVTNITAFNKLMDVNFWGAVYPTYFALPHLRATGGSIVVTSSVAGRVPSARMSFYNASKAAVIRFFETLRSELGTEIGITILMPGYVASNLTRGKGIMKDGEVGIDVEARDIQVGPFPVGRAEDLARTAVDGSCSGEAYVTWPGWYHPFHAIMCVAPELFTWLSRAFYVAEAAAPGSGGGGSGGTLSKRVVDATGGVKFLESGGTNSIKSGSK